jgi:hypothetical protein
MRRSSVIVSILGLLCLLLSMGLVLFLIRVAKLREVVAVASRELAYADL